MSDLISRQAAIDAIRGYLVGKRCPDDGTLTCRLIENEVINKLPTAEVGTDCISRQQAIDALDEIEAEVSDGYGYQYAKWREYFVEMPSAQPEITRCKDCEHWTNDDCPFAWGKVEDAFCSYAERRTDG